MDEGNFKSRWKRNPAALGFSQGLEPTRLFIGRDAELNWLADRITRRQGVSAYLIVTGLSGVGKTTLLGAFFHKIEWQPKWLSLEQSAEPITEAQTFAEILHRERDTNPYIVIDGAEGLSDEQIEEISRRIRNRKNVRALIFSTRRSPINTQAEVLNLSALKFNEATELLRFLRANISDNDLARGAQTTGGIPSAIGMLAHLMERHPDQAIENLLQGSIYNLADQSTAPPARLIGGLRRNIVVANQRLLEQLRKQPATVFDLSPRKFEEVVAELLDGMGFDVELTRQTRDGGKDILAYMHTGACKFLVLVEAKKYRQERTVGVELVRTLYGTLSDHQANSAMLVTTSSFSQDAHAFQRRHEYQLSLRDFSNVFDWIQGHKPRLLT